MGYWLVLLATLLLACGKADATSIPDVSGAQSPLLAQTALPAAATPTTVPTPTATATRQPTRTPVPTHTPTVALTPTVAPALTSTLEASPASAIGTEDALEILSHVSYADARGVFHVIGEVYNGTTRNYRGIRVKGKFYSREKLVAQENTYAYIDILRPDEKAPFDLVLRSPPGESGEAPAIDDYVLEVQGDVTTTEPFLGIQFIGHSATFVDDRQGDSERADLTIIGEVTNVADRPASQVRIACAAYDAEGHLMNVGLAYAQRDILEPDAISPFRLYVGDVGRGLAPDDGPQNYHILAYAQAASESELEQQADVKVLSAEREGGSGDGSNGEASLVLLGEVANVGTAPATRVQVTASFFNADNRLVAVEWGAAWRDNLPPGERSPFEIVLSRPPEGVDRWVLGAQGTRGDAPAVGQLALEQVSNGVDAQNVVTFGGQVKNGGPETMGAIEIGVTVYDASGHVVSAGRVYLDESLAPGATRPFALQIQATETASSFQLYVEGRAQE
jgi:hypothetical protein